MPISEKDVANVVAALNLEYGANRRYRYQIDSFQQPNLNATLEGVMRTEGDHVESLFARLKEESEGNRLGFDTVLRHLRMNLDFERTANRTYGDFAREAGDEGLKSLFLALAKAEAGHINLFRQLIEAIESKCYPVLFYCPTCGWELDFGLDPQPGTEVRCGRCGQPYKLALTGGDFSLVKV